MDEADGAGAGGDSGATGHPLHQPEGGEASLPQPASPMAQHRLIIASLFLPTTVVIDHPRRGGTRRPRPEPATTTATTSPAAGSEQASPDPAQAIGGGLQDFLDRLGSPGTSDFTPMTDPSRPYRRPPRPRDHASASPDAQIAAPSATTAPEEDTGIPPFWHVETSPSGNIGLQNAVHSVCSSIPHRVWVGVFSGRVSTASWSPAFKRVVEEKMLDWDGEAHLPVWVSDQEMEGHYDHFCKQILWKPFHYELRDYNKGQAFEEKSWRHYVAVNQKFADAIARTYQEGDVVWVNDYHLLLVPSMVRALLPQAIIGFFLHIPFPSSEIFRCFHVRKEMLHGILGADLVGFQTYSFLRHFLMTCTRLLSVESTPNGIELENRMVSVGIFPIGINLIALQEKLRNPEVPEMVAALREKYAGKRILIGRDKHDFIKGVRHKMLAFERFLSTHPEWLGRVVLIQVALSTTERNEAENQVLDVVSRINSRFGTIAYTPVVYLQQNISFSHYLALLTLADACIITSLRDGMNLTSHEFVACQEGRYGPLIISEFAGTYGSFGAALRVNPWDRGEVADAILEALTMSPEDRRYRWRELYAFVRANTAQNYVLHWVSTLHQVHQELAYKMSSRIPPIPMDRVMAAFEASSKRIFFIDDRDTLYPCKALRSSGGAMASPPPGVADKIEVGEAGSPSSPPPPPSHVDLVARLAANPAHTVYLMSDRPRAVLQEFCALPNVGVCAENGCFLKYANRTKWEIMLPDQEADLSVWQKKVLEVLRFYTDRTPGSYIEEKEISIVWHFLPDHFASMQAAECQNHIQQALGPAYPIHSMVTGDTVEVTPRNVNKGTILRRVLEHHQGRLRTRTQTLSSKVRANSPPKLVPSTLGALSATSSPETLGTVDSLCALLAEGGASLLGCVRGLGDKRRSSQQSATAVDGFLPARPYFDFIFCVGNGRADEYMFEYLSHLESRELPATSAAGECGESGGPSTGGMAGVAAVPLDELDTPVTKLVKELTLSSAAHPGSPSRSVLSAGAGVVHESLTSVSFAALSKAGGVTLHPAEEASSPPSPVLIASAGTTAGEHDVAVPASLLEFPSPLPHGQPMATSSPHAGPKPRSKSVPAILPLPSPGGGRERTPYIVSCTVGARSSEAQWYATGVAQVTSVLSEFIARGAGSGEGESL